MQKKIENVFIGTDISRTATPDLDGSSGVAVGEILVLDENMNIMTAGQTFNDTSKVYIVEAIDDTFSFVNESATTVTGVYRLVYSSPIDGSGVSEYSVEAYAAPTEEVWTVDLTGWVAVVGTEYVIRIVYTDMNEHPGQFTHSYRYVATSATLATVLTAIVALINADTKRRVVATEASSTDLILTGLPYDDQDEVDEINDYKQVTFEVFLESDNFDTYTANAITTVPSPGNGHYRLVRDEEKWAQGYEGALNRTMFPTKVPTFRTVKSETYDTLVIRHKNWFTTAGGREEQTDITTKVFIPYTATSNQMTDVLAVLNPWMASLPKAFNAVSF